MRTKLLTIIGFVLLLGACVGGKKVQGPPKPDWVTNRPTSPMYYYGIGAARKSSDVSQYQQAARQNALADMANEISISISSNSVIHAFESNLNFREDFTSTIRAQTQQDLEGYEQVDSWDDENTYWVS
ncbi:MAG TPA: LPP20 family lipoprotein, partial [Tenuifilaceae bacterium]|nr:LPP20 family lipoprotein [Tenuifilaceae bacterium]